jgi:hypothetical protein
MSLLNVYLSLILHVGSLPCYLGRANLACQMLFGLFVYFRDAFFFLMKNAIFYLSSLSPPFIYMFS